MHNYVDFFRFNDRHDDVFIEDDHYLYACAEPFGWPYLMACNEYHRSGDEWIRHDTCGADTVYLDGLERADADTAMQIIRIEVARELRFWIAENEMDVDEEGFSMLLDEQMDNVMSWIED